MVVRVTDNGDPACSDTEELPITVEEGENECPVLNAIGDRTVNEGEVLTFTATATDPENDEVIFSLDAGAPAGAMIHANTGVFTWTPTEEQGPGTYEITIRATDSAKRRAATPRPSRSRCSTSAARTSARCSLRSETGR